MFRSTHSSLDTFPSSTALISDARATDAAGSGLASSICIQSFSADLASSLVTAMKSPPHADMASNTPPAME